MDNQKLSLWGQTSQSWGHKLHSLCSYLGAFPPSLARYFVSMLSNSGDLVMDPFCGRGTVLLESRLCNRKSIVSDLNPIAIALSQAKNQSLELEEVYERVDELESNYDKLIYLNEATVQNEDIKLIFHQKTLAELCYLRKKILKSRLPVDKFISGVVLGVLHGAERKDGSSAYASISMPNTFSMSPQYVRKYVAKNELDRVYRNVFNLIKNKAKLIFDHDSFPNGNEGIVIKSDARKLSQQQNLKQYLGKVDLILTSPPYLDIVNYAKQNWIRSWFANFDPNKVSKSLDDNLTLHNWMSFMVESLEEMKKFIKKDGTIVLVIGDVVKSSRTVISLARELLRYLFHHNEFNFIGSINDRIKSGEKTTRIWNKTKGKATETDRILILSNSEPAIDFSELNDEFDIDSTSKKEFMPEKLRKNAELLAGI